MVAKTHTYTRTCFSESKQKENKEDISKLLITMPTAEEKVAINMRNQAWMENHFDSKRNAHLYRLYIETHEE